MDALQSPPERTHEWLQVRRRRWCLTCGAFQSRASGWADWQPSCDTVCAWDTDYALRKASGALGADRSGQVPLTHGPAPDRGIDWDHDEIGGVVVHNPSAPYGPHSVPGREEGGTP